MTCGQALRLIRIVDRLRGLEAELAQIEMDAGAQGPPLNTKASGAMEAQLANAARDILDVMVKLNNKGKEVN